MNGNQKDIELNGLSPYRVNVDGDVMIAWLDSVLDDLNVAILSGELFPKKRVTLDPQTGGWPNLTEIKEL